MQLHELSLNDMKLVDDDKKREAQVNLGNVIDSLCRYPFPVVNVVMTPWQDFVIVVCDL